MCHKVNTQKQRAYEFYNSYKGEKVLWDTFYQRVRLLGDEPREEKIKVKVKKKKEVIPRGKWAKEMTWYNSQPEPKASKTLFRNRLNLDYPKEQAILIGDDWLEIRREKQYVQGQPAKTYIPKKKEIQTVNEDDFKIEITYPKEVARVFRKEYQNMIDSIERELTYTSEKTEVAEMNNKLEQLQKELECFNLYNK